MKDAKKVYEALNKAVSDFIRKSPSFPDDANLAGAVGRAMGDLESFLKDGVINRPSISHDEYQLVIEVCHDLINRAVRHEAEMSKELGYFRPTDDRAKEAVIRKFLKDIDK